VIVLTVYVRRDNAKPLEPGSPIMSISLGATRTFRLKDFATKGQRTRVDLEMPDRSYIIMGGDMQAKYTHEVRHSRF
jgi:alkylated DNA repair dioxygenase AlkB